MASRPEVTELTGRETISIAETQDSKAPPIDQVCQNIIDIVCQVIWINAISLNTLQNGWHGFPQVVSRLYEHYQGLLTENEIEFSEWIENLYEPRMRSEIMDHVMTLTFEETITIINDYRPSQYYAEVLRVLTTRYQASVRAVAAADRNPDGEIPQHYQWCETKQDFLGQLAVDMQERRHQLAIFLKIIEALLELIRKGAETSSLNDDHLKSLKIKIEALEVGYATAFSVLHSGLEPEQKLINRHLGNGGSRILHLYIGALELGLLTLLPIQRHTTAILMVADLATMLLSTWATVSFTPLSDPMRHSRYFISTYDITRWSLSDLTDKLNILTLK